MQDDATMLNWVSAIENDEPKGRALIACGDAMAHNDPAGAITFLESVSHPQALAQAARQRVFSRWSGNKPSVSAAWLEFKSISGERFAWHAAHSCAKISASGSECTAQLGGQFKRKCQTLFNRDGPVADSGGLCHSSIRKPHNHENPKTENLSQ
jgi:hypothetical protein